MAAPMKTCLSGYLYSVIKHQSCLQNIYGCLSVRYYARGTWRKAEGIITPEMEREKLVRKGISDPSQNPYLPFIHSDPVQANAKQLLNNKDVKKITKLQANRSNDNSYRKPEPVESESKLKKSNLKYRFDKLADGDKRFSKIVLATKSRAERERKKVILLEGHRLIVDVLKAGGVMKELYFTDINLLSGIPSQHLTVPLYKISYKQLKIWSDTQSPSGLLAIFEKPDQGETSLLELEDRRIPVTMICDQVRDPGNMGTLIRTAAAVGCKAVMALKGCVDVWEPKVIRAGMGCHFHVPLLTSLTWDVIPNYFSSSTQILVADTRFAAKIEKGFDQENTDLYVDLSETTSVASSMEEDKGSNEAYMSKSMKKVYKRTPLPITSYEQLDIRSDVALIVGGETEGVGPEAKKLAFDQFGQIVTIPMMPVVNSLNTSIAASVILYEIRRQLQRNILSNSNTNTEEPK